MNSPRGAASFLRAHRVLTKAEFDLVFQSGKGIRARTHRALFRFREDGETRLGLIVPKKAFARAVDRNRIKRLIRDGFRRQRISLPSVDVVVQVRAEARDATLFRTELAQTWVRLGKVEPDDTSKAKSPA